MELTQNIRLNINEHIYIKDPETSELGKKIVQNAVLLIDEIGFEHFTFRKLGQKMDSPEASIYRYFESKHKLLIYLTAMYWGWMEYLLMLETVNVDSAQKRLEKSIALIVHGLGESAANMQELDTQKLHNIVVSESSKSYMTKNIDEINKDGVFSNYKSFVARMANIISDLRPKFEYPHMLVSTIIEGAHLQFFFAQHLPSLTNKTSKEDYITKFYTLLAIKTLK
jgi:AcrR family transcriptional regulator